MQAIVIFTARPKTGSIQSASGALYIDVEKGDTLKVTISNKGIHYIDYAGEVWDMLPSLKTGLAKFTTAP